MDYLTRTLARARSLGTSLCLLCASCSTEPTSKASEGDGGSATSSGSSEGTSFDSGGVEGLVLEFEEMELCANSHVATPLPGAFVLNASLRVREQEHFVADPVALDEEAVARGDFVPMNETPIALDATLEAPNAVAEVARSSGVGEGAIATVLDANASALPEEGLVFAFLARPFPLEAGGYEGSALFTHLAAPLVDDVVRIVAPRSETQAANFTFRVGCSSCNFAGQAFVQGQSVDFMPCDATVNVVYTVETELGTVVLELASLRRLPTSGMGLFVAAHGTFSGQEFEISGLPENLNALSMSRGGYSEYGLGESFLVKFSEAGGDVCGFVLENLDFEPQFDLDPLGRIGYAVSCDPIERAEPFRVMGYQLELLE